MPGESMNVEEGPVTDPGAIKRVVTDPYMKHMVWLINSGMFPEAQEAFREELTEHMGHLISEEGLPDVG
jgi:hypothetical protein